jgi:hypothetical protein
MLFGLLITG